MKRNLELKDICGYLPYNLKCLSKQYPHPMGLKGVQGKLAYIDCLVDNIAEISPILHPMSDLVKPIIVKGYNDDKEFVPNDILNKVLKTNSCKYLDELDIIINNRFQPCFQEVNSDDYLEFLDLLNQWHFDYRGLIDAGLAIDINTLNK